MRGPTEAPRRAPRFRTIGCTASIWVAVLLLALMGLPAPGVAQVTPDSVVAPFPLAGGLAGLTGDTIVEEREIDGVTPRGALLRSFLVPGWGHAATGSYVRAGFYLTAQAGNAWMLTKTAGQLSWAGQVREAVEAETEERLLGDGVPVDSIPLLLADDPEVINARNLEVARRSQREDWIALALFVILIGGVDAFVSAHLQDFPEPLTIEPVGGLDGTRLELGVSLPWRGPGGR